MSEKRVTKTGKCCICKYPYNNFGANAMPLKNGRCCGWCDAMLVIPLRIHLYAMGRIQNDA